MPHFILLSRDSNAILQEAVHTVAAVVETGNQHADGPAPSGFGLLTLLLPRRRYLPRPCILSISPEGDKNHDVIEERVSLNISISSAQHRASDSSFHGTCSLMRRTTFDDVSAAPRWSFPSRTTSLSVSTSPALLGWD